MMSLRDKGSKNLLSQGYINYTIKVIDVFISKQNMLFPF